MSKHADGTPYIDMFSTEFEVMCYIQDGKAFANPTTWPLGYNAVCEKFGDSIITQLYEEGFIGRTLDDQLYWKEQAWLGMSPPTDLG